jgi:hypothetical protein
MPCRSTRTMPNVDAGDEAMSFPIIWDAIFSTGHQTVQATTPRFSARSTSVPSSPFLAKPLGRSRAPWRRGCAAPQCTLSPKDSRHLRLGARNPPCPPLPRFTCEVRGCMPSKPGHSCRVKFRRTHQQIDNVPRDLAALGRCNTHVTIAYFNYATVTYCGRLHLLPSRGLATADSRD